MRLRIDMPAKEAAFRMPYVQWKTGFPITTLNHFKMFECLFDVANFFGGAWVSSCFWVSAVGCISSMHAAQFFDMRNPASLRLKPIVGFDISLNFFVGCLSIFSAN
jgi:hypothetical protein